MVVMVVAIMLTGLLLPAMSQVGESMNRIVCGSHQRQLGQAMFLYAQDYSDRLPPTNYLDAVADDMRPQELMAAHRGDNRLAWDGLGLLYHLNYCPVPDLCYCPSHTGDHPLERYREMWENPGGMPIFTNYHYAGHVDWVKGQYRRLEDGEKLVLLSDGLRTLRDFNHKTGLNVLRGDGSVRWVDNTTWLVSRLPEYAQQGVPPDYQHIWETLETEGY